MSSKFRHVGSPGGTICRAGQRLLSSILSAVTAGSVLLSVVPAVQAAPFETGQVIHEIISTDSLSVAEGLNYEQVTFKTADGSTVVGFMLDSNYGAEGSNLKIGVGMPYGETEIGMQPVSGQLYDAFLNGRNVLGGVNGDFYDMSTGEPDGVYIQDGEQIHGWAESPITARVTYRTFFGILKDGTAIIGDEEDYLQYKDQLQQAVGGDFIMVQDGQMTDFAEKEGVWDSPKDPLPRTCVGIREDGSVFFICVDGRRPDTYSAGLSLVDMAQLMIENGAVTATNLDGGGSTTMVIKNPETQEYTLKNSPCDNTTGPTGGTERSVANCVYFYNDDETAALPDVTLEKDVDGYYLIDSIDDFAQINYDPRANYRLACDIDGTGKAVTSVQFFRGIFDGNDKSINNLIFSEVNANGLFERLDAGSEVKDLTITNATLISTSSNVGILAGSCQGAVSNVNVSGTVQGASNVGGLLGYISGGVVDVTDCHAVADVTGTDSFVGILIGNVEVDLVGEVARCSARGTVSGKSGVGGLIGQLRHTLTTYVRDCMVTDTIVNGNGENAGGIFGASKCHVERCFVKDVTVTQASPNNNKQCSASLLSGWQNQVGTIISNNVAFSGTVTANNDVNSHRITHYQKGELINNYASETILVNGQTRNDGTDEKSEGITMPERELMKQELYTSLGFAFGEDKAWVWDPQYNIPIVNNSWFEIPENTSPALVMDEEGYFLIDSADDFAQIQKAPDAKYRLANDLDIRYTQVPQIEEFSGEFDGQGYTLNGYTASVPLFGTLQPGAVLSDLTMINAEIHSDADYAAVAVGVCNGASITGVKVHGTVQSTSESAQGTAGVVAALRSSSGEYLVSNCSAVVSVDSAAGYAGAVFGSSESGAKGQIRACLAQGSVDGAEYVGGLGGRIADSADVTVSDCVSKADVSGEAYVGGLIGSASCKVQRCFVENVDIQQQSQQAEAQYSASFLSGYSAYGQSELCGNVIYSGQISTSNPEASFNIGGAGTREDNYVSGTLAINGTFRQSGDAAADGVTATAEQLGTQSFYERLGFDFTQEGPWEWDGDIPALKNSHVDIPEKTFVIENDVMNVGADETQRLLTWYSPVNETVRVQIAPTSELEDGLMPADALTIRSEPMSCSLEGMNLFRATLDGLTENTEYSYRIGSDSAGWIELRTFETGSFGDFSFLFGGDPQIGASGNIENDKNGWQNTLNKAGEAFPDASFMLTLGDQIDHPESETEYSEFLSTGDFATLPLAVAIGNHDSNGAIFKEHFSVPNPVQNEGDTPAGGDYWFLYNNVLVMCLNTNNLSTAQHKKFLEDTLQAHGSEADWKVVVFHQSIFSMGDHAFDEDILQRRTELAPLLSELGIDVVLMGHDHSYTRSYMMDGVTPIIPEEGVTDSVTDPAEGQVLYITANSASGSQFYEFQSAEFSFAAVKNQENVANISKVDVTKNSFTITTYRTSDMSVVDRFTIYRTPGASVTGVTFDKTELELQVGQSEALTAAVEPDDAEDKTLTWASSDESVATVENGVVTAVAEGTATISATTADGGFTAECVVTVKAGTVNVTGVTLDKIELELKVGQSESLTAAVEPDDAEDKTLTWASSDESVATVENGVVTAVAEGTATISATTADGGFTAECVVTVKAEDSSDEENPGGGQDPGGEQNPGDEQNPDTGDAGTPITELALLACTSTAAVVLSRKRKR